MTASQRSEAQVRHEALAVLLAEPAPSWHEVLRRLATWPAAHDPAAAIAAVEAVAHRWRPQDRGLGRFAVHQLIHGDVGPHLRLIRALDLRPLWEVGDRPALFERMIVAGGVRELFAFDARYDRGDTHIELLTAHIVGLRQLYLGGCHVGPEGARRLAECPALAGLQRLSLHNNVLGDAGAEALLASPHLVGLRVLNLYNNQLSAPMIERIRAAPQWRGATVTIHNQG